jgi:excisionase family DNA binding protein
MHSSESAPNRVPPPLLVTVSQAAAMLGIGRTKLYELILANEIATVSIGRSRRIPVTAVAEFVATLGSPIPSETSRSYAPKP